MSRTRAASAKALAAISLPSNPLSLWERGRGEGCSPHHPLLQLRQHLDDAHEQVGWITAFRSGNQKHYQANRNSPAFAELQGLIVKTVGVVEPLRQALNAMSRDIRAAFVYGSVAKGTDKAGSDIDLMVISDRRGYQDLFEALQSAEAVLARPVNPNVMSTAEWRSKRARKDSFAARVASQPRLLVIGSDDDIG